MTDHSFTRALDTLFADTSPTAYLLDELQLYGFRPGGGEPDPRPLPDAPAVQGALADVFDALVVALTDTRLEPDLEGLLWGVVNLFHRKLDRLQHDLDGNERAQRQSQSEQDGSEVRSVELERLTAEGIGLIERRNAFEFCREQAAELFEAHTASAWRPRAGSVVDHRSMTAALIETMPPAQRHAARQALLLDQARSLAAIRALARAERQAAEAVTVRQRIAWGRPRPARFRVSVRRGRSRRARRARSHRVPHPRLGG